MDPNVDNNAGEGLRVIFFNKDELKCSSGIASLSRIMRAQ